MLGRTIFFAASAMIFAVIVTPRTPMNGVGAAPTASPTPKKPSFFDPIPPTIVRSGGSGSGPSTVSGSGIVTVIPRGPGGHFFTRAKINGRPIFTLVDTGATSVALSVEDARAVGIQVDPAQFKVIGSGASGPVRGMSIDLDEVDVGGHRVTHVRGAVLEGLEGTLLGQSYLQHLESVEISGNVMKLR